MEMQSFQGDTLLEKLIAAKLAGWKQEADGYYFRSNEQAAWRAFQMLDEWVQQHCDPDQLVIEAAVDWYNALEKLKHYSAEDRAVNHSSLRSDKYPPEVRLAAAIERLKGYA